MRLSMNRRHALGVIGALAATQLHAQGAAYPQGLIKIVSPYPPGGSSGLQARLVAKELETQFGQAVIVDDKPGANTIIGSQIVAKAPADGYTLLWQTSAHVITPLLFPTPYDVLKDFAPVAGFSGSELLLVVHPSVQARTVEEYVALAKKGPGAVTYASTGTGGPPHLAAELFKKITGTNILHVPYKGVAQSITDLVGGQVQSSFQTPAAALPMIKAGKLRALAVSGDKRLAALPDVPTFAQSGIKGFDVRFWFGIYAPAGTPTAIVDKLSAAVATMLKKPEVLSVLGKQELEPYYLNPADFNKLQRQDSEKYGALIKSANIKAD